MLRQTDWAPSASPDTPAARADGIPRLTPGVTVGDTLASAGRKVLRFHLGRLVSGSARARAGDPEGVRDSREATRRLRSAWRVFDVDAADPRARRFRRELRRLDRRLGAARELDCLLADVADHLAGLPADRARALDAMLAVWRGERETARRRLVRELVSRRWRRSIGDFDGWLREEPGTEAAGPPAGTSMRVEHRVTSRVWDAYERAWACGEHPGEADAATLRRLRSATERLRHTLEAFDDVLPDADTLLAAVGELEEHVGILHDADVAADRARAFARSREGSLAVTERAAIDAFVASRDAICARQREAPASSWGSVFEPVFREALEVALGSAR